MKTLCNNIGKIIESFGDIDENIITRYCSEFLFFSTAVSVLISQYPTFVRQILCNKLQPFSGNNMIPNGKAHRFIRLYVSSGLG